MALPKFVQVRKTFLLAPIVSTESASFTLKRLVDAYGNELAMSDFGTTVFFTFNPGGENEEIVSATGFTVNDDNTVTVDTGIVRALSAKSPYSTGGTARNHSAGTVVIISNNPQIYDAILDYIDSIALAGAPDASDTTAGIVEEATLAEIDADTDEGATTRRLFVNPSILAASKYGLRLPSADQKTFLDGVVGMVLPYVGLTAPTGFLLCDGSSIDNDTYPALVSILKGRYGYGTAVTFTAAVDNFITATSHGLSNGDIVFVKSTTTLPAGLSVNTPYYVVQKTTNTFKVSTSAGGTEVDITDTGTGTHSFYNSIKVPDLRGRSPMGYGATAFTLDFAATDVDTGTEIITVPSNNSLYTGTKVRLTTTGALPTGLSLATDYYVIRLSATTIKLATSRQNALGSSTVTGASSTPVAIDITAQGSGINTITVQDLTSRSLGDMGGEETHTQKLEELVSHSHSVNAGGSGGGDGGSGTESSSTSSATGGSTPANLIDPYTVLNYIIKT